MVVEAKQRRHQEMENTKKEEMIELKNLQKEIVQEKHTLIQKQNDARDRARLLHQDNE